MLLDYQYELLQLCKNNNINNTKDLIERLSDMKFAKTEDAQKITEMLDRLLIGTSEHTAYIVSKPK